MKNNYLSDKLNIPHTICAGVITFIMYIMLLVVCGITPFGDHTWTFFDMKQQYLDFYGFSAQILSGQSNGFYSFSTALGSGVLGFIVYYLTSPFVIIAALTPIESLPIAISIIIGLKLSLCSASMDVFLQKFCGKSAYICAIAYGFCGFVIANAMNIMWLDALLILPILMVMTERLLRDGRLVGYIVTLSIMLAANYYISYMVLIFMMIWYVTRMFAVAEKTPSQAFFRWGMATVASICVDAVILLPTFINLKNSGAGIFGKDITASVREEAEFKLILSRLFSFSYDSSDVYWGAPILFCGVVIFVLVVLYFINTRVNWREKLSIIIVLALLLVSFEEESINRLWHVGMDPAQYPFREAFLLIFVLLICACRSIQCLNEDMNPGRMYFGVLLIGSVLLYVLIHPASEIAGWKMIINIVLVAVSVTLIIIFTYVASRKRRMICAILLMIVQMLDLGLNASYMYRLQSVNEETLSDYRHDVTIIDTAVTSLKDIDESFYRTDTWSPRQINDSMLFGYNGITHYSPAELEYVRDFLQKMGYNDDGQYIEYGHDNTETADSILGIKYIMTHSSHYERMHNNYGLVSDGDIQIYKNPYALSLGIGVMRSMSGESYDPFSLQEEIYTRLVGEPIYIFEPAVVTEHDTYASRPQQEYTVTAAIDGEMYFYMTNLIDDFDNMEIELNNEFLTYYGNDACLKVLNLGYMCKGDTISVRIKADDEDEFGTPIFVTEDVASLGRAYSRVEDRMAKINEISPSHLIMEVDSSISVGDEISSQVGIFTTIPYERGWNVKVADVKVEPVEVYDSLMYIPVTEAIQQRELEPGENILIELRYIPEGFVVGAIISVITIITLVLIALLHKSEAGYFEYDDDDEETNLE